VVKQHLFLFGARPFTRFHLFRQPDYNPPMIREYARDDAVYLASIYNDVNPRRTLSTAGFHGYARAAGHVWTILEEGPAGYAAIFPVPGLSHVVDLECVIAPERRRQGLGSRLVAHVLAELQGTAVRQVSCQVDDLDSPAAHFLRHNGFGIEHQEWQLRLDDMSNMPIPSSAADLSVVTLPRGRAVPLFQRLYTESFSGLPWDQPFSDAEIAALLDRPQDMLFLVHGEAPVGFAWLRMEADNLGVIEPLGIVPGSQGRGYGRFLLLSALHELGRRGAVRAQIGAWRSNERAIVLYTSLGFRHRHTTTYLAYTL
jgi:mycothiol synthase